ncbi:MAG: hypothetical protein H6573_32215 [Lewinellaceae bacterium]|nr:hypothetical protein [Phaeodactylibacter sp.]MCB9352124.1 hypothetical protein [Lewinellaceae bacterium]
MKNVILFALLIGILTGMSSCIEEDPCMDVYCENGGTCDEGRCDCPEGFTGAYCETELLPKYFRAERVVVSSYPYYRPGGGNWDPDGPADLVARIYSNDNPLTSTETVEDAFLNASLEFQHKVRLYVHDELKLQLYDRDSETHGESMGYYTFYLRDWAQNKPPYVELYNPNTVHKIRMRLYGKWEY